MIAAAAPLGALQIQTATEAGDSAGHRGLTLIYIDGVDVLELERPTRRPDGSLYPSGPMIFYPPDPAMLLPQTHLPCCPASLHARP